MYISKKNLIRILLKKEGETKRGAHTGANRYLTRLKGAETECLSPQTLPDVALTASRCDCNVLFSRRRRLRNAAD